MSDTTGLDQQQNMRRVAMTSLAGTSIEWYDFFLYGTAAAVIFPKAFFPQDLPTMVLLIISFSTLAVGFLARPLGGIIFGHFGDRIGRKRTLVVALMMMGVATTLIGFLPTYASIGIAAPLLLVAHCALFKAWRSVGNGVAPCCWSRKVRRPINGAGTGPMHKQALRWV